MNDIKRPDFPLVWDSSMIRTFRECPRKFYLEYMWHFKSLYPSTHLHAGKVFASAMETYRLNWLTDMDHDKALREAVRTVLVEYGDHEPRGSNSAMNKTCENMVAAVHYYFTYAFPMATDYVQQYYLPNDKPAVELSFAAPLDPDLCHPETGDEIIISGRCDNAVKLGEAIFLVDDKTTTQMGPKWADQWILRSQFPCYTWLAQQYGIPARGVIVRGIAIRKYDFDHKEYPANQPDWKIQRWKQQTKRDIQRAMDLWREGYWDYNIDESCGNFGGCMFLSVCNSNEPGRWLEADYERRVWNPLELTETVLETPTEVDGI